MIALLALLALAPVAWAATAAAPVTLRFSGTAPGSALPEGWKAYAMSRHRPIARMAIVRDGGDSVFNIDANHAAGAIAHALDLPAASTLTWRWKVDRSVAAADMSRKQGDDFAARVYVFFDVPRSSLSWLQRMKLKLASRTLGHAMPTAALCYVWDNRHPIGTIAPSPFSPLMRTIVLQSGNARAGTWQMQHRDLAADYLAAFGRPAPRITGIALSADTDNTGGHVQAWFGDVTLTPAASKPKP
ncbi:MAG: DUF3047 domain-containing protein [Rhodanobacter sp.]